MTPTLDTLAAVLDARAAVQRALRQARDPHAAAALKADLDRLTRAAAAVIARRGR